MFSLGTAQFSNTSCTQATRNTHPATHNQSDALLGCRGQDKLCRGRLGGAQAQWASMGGAKGWSMAAIAAQWAPSTAQHSTASKCDPSRPLSLTTCVSTHLTLCLCPRHKSHLFTSSHLFTHLAGVAAPHPELVQLLRCAEPLHPLVDDERCDALGA
jgi:hypothetical protein